MRVHDFIIPSTGETIPVRPLTGYEVVLSRKLYSADPLDLNGFMVGAGLTVDTSPHGNKPTPAVLVAIGHEWMSDHVAGDFAALTDYLQEISGLTEGAGKSDI